jgi:ribose transport system permease protein
LKWIKRALIANQNLLFLYALLLVFAIIGGSLSPHFFTWENLTNILNQSVPLGFVALAQTIALLVGGVNLSAGAMVSIGTVLGARMITGNPITGVFYILAMVGISALFGMTNGFLIGRLRINALIATLCTSLVGAGVALFILPVAGGYILPTSIRFLQGGIGLLRLPVVYFLLAAILLHLVMQHTRFGRYTYAVGGNADSAAASGLSVFSIQMKVYVVSSVLAGLGGVFMMCRVCSGDPTIGQPFSFEGLIASVIGGTQFGGGRGSVAGTVPGVLFLVIMGNVMNLLNVDTFYQTIIKGLLFVVAVVVYQMRGSRT